MPAGITCFITHQLGGYWKVFSLAKLLLKQVHIHALVCHEPHCDYIYKICRFILYILHSYHSFHSNYLIFINSNHSCIFTLHWKYSEHAYMHISFIRSFTSYDTYQNFTFISFILFKWPSFTFILIKWPSFTFICRCKLDVAWLHSRQFFCQAKPERISYKRTLNVNKNSEAQFLKF